MHVTTALFHSAVRCTCPVSVNQVGQRRALEVHVTQGDGAMQITGAYSESASDEQNAALKQVALNRPDAPSKDELKSMGYDFAMKV